MAAATQQMSSLPSGLRICTTVPDILYLPELVFGGLVLILVASTSVAMTSLLLLVPIITVPNPLGWVMFVSVFCFVMTFLWLIIFASGGHKNSSSWAAADFLYHLIAVVFYLSASVILANETIAMKAFSDIAYPFKYYQLDIKYYQMDIAAVVFSFIATLLYFIHCIFSAMRWKSF
ncbi:myelin and lymphocyte protein-like [Carassius carassius]|uniref:myelin and lymphocyte protein-like n=1 Tax=Carassius carassius TaxID=217509 RepID=UPI002868FBA0|nr:myelin and lymphocyte protein-like [Carassius carassius]